MARLEGIQRSMRTDPSDSLLALEDHLNNGLLQVLSEEELFWHQRAKCDWISQGDRNTRFYHSLTMAKRRRLKIGRLYDDEGVLITDPACSAPSP